MQHMQEKVEIDDLVKSVLRMQYDAPDNFTKKSGDALKEIALHEAGHLVVSEVLTGGCVGLASLRSSGRGSMGGFMHCCLSVARRAHDTLISLAGKAATELYYSGTCASGCQNDIARAADNIRDITDFFGSLQFEQGYAAAFNTSFFPKQIGVMLT